MHAKAFGNKNETYFPRKYFTTNYDKIQTKIFLLPSCVISIVSNRDSLEAIMTIGRYFATTGHV